MLLLLTAFIYATIVWYVQYQISFTLCQKKLANFDSLYLHLAYANLDFCGSKMQNGLKNYMHIPL